MVAWAAKEFEIHVLLNLYIIYWQYIQLRSSVTW
jgi:hypothetical protein